MNPSVVHCADRSREGGISFHLTLQPLVFLRLLTWGSLAPSPFSFAALKAMRFPMLQRPGKLAGLTQIVSIKKLPCDQFKSTVQTVHGQGIFLFTSHFSPLLS